MAKKVKQFRFYNDNDAKHNYPPTISYQRLVSGKAFADYYPILHLGVQSLPGTKFYLNNSSIPIIVGTTGIYELDLDGNTEILSLSFQGKSLMSIMNSDTAYLIVDIIYDEKEE